MWGPKTAQNNDLNLPRTHPFLRQRRRYFPSEKSQLSKAVIFSRPRGDRGATMEEGKLQIFVLIATFLPFLILVEIALSGKSN